VGIAAEAMMEEAMVVAMEETGVEAMVEAMVVALLGVWSGRSSSTS
jgi:hypothetical protein